MVALPAAGYFSSVSRTNLEAKTAQDQTLAWLRQLIGGDTPSTLTIATGAVTPTKGVHAVDTEAAAATDDLTNIDQTNLPDGSLLMLLGANAGRVVTLKHAAGGAGQMSMVDSADLVLSDTSIMIIFQRVSTSWVERARFYGNAKSAARTFLGLAIGTNVQAYDADTAKTDVAQKWTGSQRVGATNSANVSGSVTLDLSAYQDHNLTLTGDITNLANPTVTSDMVGQRGRIRLIQDGTGGWTLDAMGTAWRRVGSAGIPVLPTGAGLIGRIDYDIVGTGADGIEYSYGEVEA
jgi:hypothetical protein